MEDHAPAKIFIDSRPVGGQRKPSIQGKDQVHSELFAIGIYNWCDLAKANFCVLGPDRADCSAKEEEEVFVRFVGHLSIDVT